MAPLADRAWLSLVLLAVFMGAVLFGSAGTLNYWQGWAYLLLFVGLSGAVTQDLLRRDPALLERRLKGGPQAERRPAQQVIMIFASLAFLSVLVVPALDHRFRWSSVPLAGIVLGNILFIVGFLFVGRVYRENTYTSATIEIHEGQRVIDTGPYSVVRHPMYAGALLYMLGTPLALGSYIGLLGVVLMALVIVWRLSDEERMLGRELQGYEEYKTRVRYRLIPGVW
ncbi:MAG TPA: isoprenylcysteine carboxylmethyltransferase family protein [Gemmatimonadaceae bacterium]